MSEQSTDILAISETEIFEEAKARLRIAIDADSKNRQAAKEALKFCEGDQWPDDDVTTSVSEAKPQLTINLTAAMVKRVINNMKEQRPRIKCHPVGDGADIDTANTVNGLMRHIEYRSEAGVAYDTAGELSVKMGWGWWRLYTEYLSPDSFDQEIVIGAIRNGFTVYPDPGAIMPTARDMGWCIISILEKRSEFHRKHPKEELKQWNDMGSNEQHKSWDTKEQIRLAEYFRVRHIQEKLYQLRSTDGREISKWKSELPSAKSMAETGWSIVSERMSSHRQIEWFKLNGIKVVERAIIPGTWIPVIRAEGNAVDIDGQIIRSGMVYNMMDPQRMVNYGETAKIRRLGLTPQSPWIAAEGQLDGHPEWGMSNTTAYAAMVYKPIPGPDGVTPLPPPMRQPPAQVEQGFSELVGGMKANLNVVAGMPNEPGQDMAGQVISGVAIKQRQGMSDQSHFQYYDNLTLAIAHTGRIMLEWIPHYYSTQRMQRIIGEDGVPQMVQLNQPDTSNPALKKIKNDMSVGRYDVVMDTGPGYATKREEGAANMIQMLGTPLGEPMVKVGADLIVRTLDDPYMQQMADRMAAQTPDGLKKAMEGMPDNAKAIITSMSQQMQQMQQQLQAAQAGITKQHLIETGKAHDTQVWADLEQKKFVHDGIIKKDVAEINAGAALLDSKSTQRHEKEMVGLQQLHTGESNGGNAA